MHLGTPASNRYNVGTIPKNRTYKSNSYIRFLAVGRIDL